MANKLFLIYIISRSPSELSRLVAEHQKKELLLLEKQGGLQTR